MKYSVSAIVLGFFAAFNAAAPTPDDKPDPSQVTITGVTFGGTGCKVGAVHISNSWDWQTLAIIFDDYEATIGPGSRFSDRVKGCNLNFQVHYPPGYQFTLYMNDFIGYALIEQGITLKQTSSYWFAGFVGDKQTFQSTLYGPYNYNQYSIPDTLQNPLWSPCGSSTTLSINTLLVLTSIKPQAQGLVNTSWDAKTEYQHAYGVNWRRCS